MPECQTTCEDPAWSTTTAQSNNLAEVFGNERYFLGSKNISCLYGYFESTTKV